MGPGILYVTSTPIGNLEDITLRAIRVLKEVDLIAAEDTRRASILMRTYGITGEVTSYHSYNIASKTGKIIETLVSGKNVALISDSGTPGISDPGARLISECIEKGIPVTTVPGPTALIAALVLSGKPTQKFIFEGFLSNKGARRRRQLEALKNEGRTVVVYESPHRIIKFLEDFDVVIGDREIAVVREITKKFEEVKRGKARELLDQYRANPPKGEIIVVF